MDWHAVLLRNYFVLLLTFLPAFSAVADQGDKVRLQLKWSHQFQFAGYYAAIEQGYYAEKGLTVELIPANPEIDPVANVLSGNAEYGVGTSDLLLLHHKGEPVVVMAVIFQHSPLVLLSRRESDLSSIHDLIGQRIAIELGSAELFAYLKREGITADNFELVSHEMQLDPLLQGDILAQSVYITTEPFELDEAGISYQIYSPRSVGIDFYGDNLFTTRNELDSHPQRTEAFMRASLRGWNYAMNNIDEVIDLILQQYPTDMSRAALQYEAEQMQRLMRTDLIEPGHMIPGRWRHMVEVYAEVGMLPGDLSLEGFLYDPAGLDIDLRAFYLAMLGLAGLAALFAAIALYTKKVNKNTRISEQRFRTLFDNAPLALIVSDAEGRITGWNGAATRIFGWPVEEALGKDLMGLLLAPSDRSEVADVVDAAFQGKPTHFVNKNVTREGHEIMCEWANAPYCETEHGQASSIISIGVDITQRIELENSLRAARNESQEALEDSHQLISMLSHELRSPMSAIGYSVEVIDSALSEGQSAMIPDMTLRIRQSLTRLRNFVDGLTMEDRLTEIGSAQPDTIRLQELAGKIIANLQYAYPGRNIEMNLLGRDEVTVADTVMFDILLTNLLDNAVKYSPAETSVDLTIDVSEAGGITLEVADRGPGIEPALRKNLFRKYIRGRQESRVSGFGLGLFHVIRIVERFNGRITVVDREGGGASFQVDLPPTELHRGES